jgi:small subunit ribosomal protein S8
MSMTDPIADMLTRIRNAQARQFATVDVYGSKFARSILEVLKKEGYIKSITDHTGVKGEKMYRVELKYDAGRPVITRIQRISKPGRRVYSPIKKMPKVMNGLGVAVLSTSKGVMSDAEARQARVGGEIICHVC